MHADLHQMEERVPSIDKCVVLASVAKKLDQCGLNRTLYARTAVQQSLNGVGGVECQMKSISKY
jgi:hypothetical protein